MLNFEGLGLKSAVLDKHFFTAVADSDSTNNFKTEQKPLFNRVKIKIKNIFLGLLKQSKTTFFRRS
jgi:hypothetical protein